MRTVLGQRWSASGAWCVFAAISSMSIASVLPACSSSTAPAGAAADERGGAGNSGGAKATGGAANVSSSNTGRGGTEVASGGQASPGSSSVVAAGGATGNQTASTAAPTGGTSNSTSRALPIASGGTNGSSKGLPANAGRGSAVSAGASAILRGGATATGGTSPDNKGGRAGTGGDPAGSSTSNASSGQSGRGNQSAGAAGAVGKGGAAATAGSSGTAPSAHTGKWKIMLLGDSITETTCYPQLVWQNLKDAGKTNFTFVGGQPNNQSCSVTGLPSGGLPTEGHSSKLAVTETSNGNVAKWLQANPPDIVLMHFGTNDVWGHNDQTTATKVTDAYTGILSALKAVNPNAILFVAQIIPMNPSDQCSSASPCNYQSTLDAAIPAWATAHTTPTMPIYVVNLENIFQSGYFANSTYTTDGVHPQKPGAALMADTMTAAVMDKIPDL